MKSFIQKVLHTFYKHLGASTWARREYWHCCMSHCAVAHEVLYLSHIILSLEYYTVESCGPCGRYQNSRVAPSVYLICCEPGFDSWQWRRPTLGFSNGFRILSFRWCSMRRGKLANNLYQVPKFKKDCNYASARRFWAFRGLQWLWLSAASCSETDISEK